jgi:hypothetical protein
MYMVMNGSDECSLSSCLISGLINHFLPPRNLGERPVDTNKNVIKLIKIATILCFALCFSECAILPNQTIVPTPSDDSPLPEFILGQWQSIIVTLSTSGVDDSKYRITFEDKNRVNYIISYPNSGDTVMVTESMNNGVE